MIGIKKKIEILQIKINFLEREARKRNISKYGVNENSANSLEECVITEIFIGMQIEINKSEIYLVRRLVQRKENKTRPVLVGLTSTKTK